MGNTLGDPPGASLPACQPVDGLPKLRVTFFIVKLFRVKCLCMGRRVCRVMIYSYFAADIPHIRPSCTPLPLPSVRRTIWIRNTFEFLIEGERRREGALMICEIQTPFNSTAFLHFPHFLHSQFPPPIRLVTPSRTGCLRTKPCACFLGSFHQFSLVQSDNLLA